MSKASKKNPQKREKGGKISRIASKREEIKSHVLNPTLGVDIKRR